jgi:hypothetical protein
MDATDMMDELQASPLAPLGRSAQPERLLPGALPAP